MYSPSVVAGELVFVGSCSGKFLALDRRSGRVEWEYDIHADGEQTSFHGAPLTSDDLVLTATDNGFRRSGIGHVYAFEQTTGRLRWKHVCETGIPSDVVPVGVGVCVVTMDLALICLDRATGELRWRFATDGERPDVRDTQSLAVLDGCVFFAGRDETLYALDGRNGEVCWMTPLAAQPTCAPVVLHRSVYVGTAWPCMHRLDPGTGCVQTTLPLASVPCRVPVCTGSSLLVFLGDSTLAALDPGLTRVLWSRAASAKWNQSRALLVGDRVLVGDAAGQLLALALADGSVSSQQTFAQADIRSLAKWQDTLYVGTLRGTLYACQLDHWPAGEVR